MTQYSLTRSTLIMVPFILPLGMALDMYLPSMPFMSHALGAHPNQIKLTMSIFLFVFASGQLVMGSISDKVGRKKVLIGSLLCFILGSIICFFSLSLIPFIIGRILQALGACGSQVVALAMVRDQYHEKEATFMYTALKGSMAIAPIAAPLVGAYLQTIYGWQANFAALGLYGLLLLYLGTTQLKETLKEIKPTRSILQTYKNFINPTFLYFCWCAMATQAAMFSYFLLSPYYYINLHELSLPQFALLFSLNSCVFFCTGLFSGKMIYKWGFYKSSVIAALLFLLSGLMMTVGHFNFNHFTVLLLPNLFASSSAAIMLGASTAGAIMPFKDNAGKASAIYGCVEFMGGGFIGSLTLSTSTISVIPLASCLIIMGLTILIFPRVFRTSIPDYYSS